jgi:DNA-binding MarR family transcriptional regulator
MAKEQPSAMDKHIAIVLERIGEVARADQWKRTTERALSPLQNRVIAFIATHARESVGVARLAEELQVSRPTVSECVKGLVEKGLLKRIADPHDARSHALRLSAKGAKHHASASEAKPLDRSITAMRADDKDTLLLGLMRVLHGLIEAGAIDVQRMCWTCEHYQGDRHKTHRCALLATTMRPKDLRTDCAEHVLLNASILK